MTLLIASTHGEVPQDLAGADLLEIRIDGLDTQEAKQSIPTLLASSPIPTILTCRSTEEGGFFDGHEEERVELYRVALQCDTPPKYIDVEYESVSRHPLLLDALQSDTTGIILSWHDTRGRPKDLLQRATAMQDVAGVDVVKMVWRARSVRDTIEAFELLQTKQQPMIVMCMGEYGELSRILAPKFGGFATYASVEGLKPTADGQVHVSTLRSTFDFASINEETRVFGIIGDNVAHSASPLFHNTAFQTAGLNAVYVPIPVPAGWEHCKATFESLRGYTPLHFSGASITIPHKVHMYQLSNEADNLCKRIGATNTVSIHECTCNATNTDALAIQELSKGAVRALVLGTGGAARAAIVALQQNEANVFVAGRDVKKTKQLASEFSCNRAVETDSPYDFVINCTPVGMHGGGAPHENPLRTLAPWVELTPDVHVFDTVYKPEETPLLKEATTAGCTVTTGSEMFRIQAIAQQKFWASS